MRQLLLGATAMGGAVAGLFFLRFYTRTQDRLFTLFGVAFLLLAGQAVIIAVAPPDAEARGLLYLPRLVAFGLIIAAIVGKNRTPS